MLSVFVPSMFPLFACYSPFSACCVCSPFTFIICPTNSCSMLNAPLPPLVHTAPNPISKRYSIFIDSNLKKCLTSNGRDFLIAILGILSCSATADAPQPPRPPPDQRPSTTRSWPICSTRLCLCKSPDRSRIHLWTTSTHTLWLSTIMQSSPIQTHI